MTIRYEVNDNNEVVAWNDELEQTEPFLYQPQHPDGTPFETKEAAQAWADQWYYEFLNPQESEWYLNALASKQSAIAKVIAGEQLSEEEAHALAFQEIT
jgi:hypothetical protein